LITILGASVPDTEQDATLTMDDHDRIWMSGPGDRIALAVFFTGVALLVAGVAIYVAIYFT